MFDSHAECEHEATKNERDKCTRARRKAASMSRHPSAGQGTPWVTEADANSVGATLPVTEPTTVDTALVTTIKVNPGIWKTALELAGGKASRIKVISPTEVEVR